MGHRDSGSPNLKQKTEIQADVDRFSQVRALWTKSARGQRKQPDNSNKAIPVQSTTIYVRKDMYTD